MSIAPAPSPTPTVHARTPRPRKPSPRIVGPMSYEEYVQFDRAASRKYQLVEGVAVEMPGGSPEHALIMGDVLHALENAIREVNSACVTFPSEIGIYVSERRSFYADAIVSAPKPQYDLKDRLRNPVVIVEVLSPSTEAFDRDAKFKAYQSLPSFRHYLLISQQEVFVTHFARNDEGKWEIAGMYSDLADTLTLTLDDATVTVRLADVYRRVTFDAA